ncbi:MAG: hypothetical protein WAS72_09970 [Saprospiraceae bacterium]
MKVTKEMLHPDLQKFYTPLTLMAPMLNSEVGVKITNFFSHFIESKEIKGFKNERKEVPSRSSDTLIRTRIFRP